MSAVSRSIIIHQHKSPEDWGALPNTVKSWFDDRDGALKNSDARPSFEACILLADQLRIIFNRADNDEIAKQSKLDGKRVDHRLFRDADLSYIEAIKLEPFMEAARTLLDEADLLDKFLGNYTWKNSSTSNVSVILSEIVEILNYIGAYRRTPNASRTSRVGRPTEQWHATALQVAPLIRQCMIDAEFGGRLGKTDATSVTADVGAKAIQ